MDFGDESTSSKRPRVQNLPIPWTTLRENPLDLHPTDWPFNDNNADDANQENYRESPYNTHHVGYRLWLVLAKTLQFFGPALSQNPSLMDKVSWYFESLLSKGMRWVMDEITGHDGPWSLEDMMRAHDQLMTENAPVDTERLQADGKIPMEDTGESDLNTFFSNHYPERGKALGVPDENIFEWGIKYLGLYEFLDRWREYFNGIEDPFLSTNPVEEDYPMWNPDRLELMAQIRRDFQRDSHEDPIGLHEAFGRMIDASWDTDQILSIYPRYTLSTHYDEWENLLLRHDAWKRNREVKDRESKAEELMENIIKSDTRLHELERQRSHRSETMRDISQNLQNLEDRLEREKELLELQQRLEQHVQQDNAQQEDPQQGQQQQQSSDFSGDLTDDFYQ